MPRHRTRNHDDILPKRSSEPARQPSTPNPSISLPHQATPETILSLQRTIGNQAVQRLVRPAPSGTSAAQIQRYKVVGREKDDDYEATTSSSEEAASLFPRNQWLGTNALTGAKSFQVQVTGADTHPLLKVADDHSMAIENVNEPKALFAKPQVIENSTLALNSASAAFELVALPSVKLTIKEKGGTSHELLKALPRNKSLPAEDPGYEGVGMKTYPMCNAVGHGMMGEKSGKAPAIEPVFAPGSKTTIPNAIYKPEWQFHAAKALSGSKRAPDLVDEEERDQLGQDYASMNANEWDEKSRDAGINDYAQPEIGEAYAAYSLMHHDSLNARKKWNWHYAGVVAKSLDGSDRMTLENYTRDPHFKGCKRDEQGDPNYFFQMYGSRKEQSFFKASQDTGDFANLLVLRMRKRLEALPEQQKEVVIKNWKQEAVSEKKSKQAESDEEDSFSDWDEEFGDTSENPLKQQVGALLKNTGGNEEESFSDWDEESEESPTPALKPALALLLKENSGDQTGEQSEEVEDWDKEFQ